jgi:hypothetical protein
MVRWGSVAQLTCPESGAPRTETPEREPRRLAARAGCDQDDADGEASLPDGLAAPDGLAELLGVMDSLGETDGATEAGDWVAAGV